MLASFLPGITSGTIIPYIDRYGVQLTYIVSPVIIHGLYSDASQTILLARVLLYLKYIY